MGGLLKLVSLYKSKGEKTKCNKYKDVSTLSASSANLLGLGRFQTRKSMNGSILYFEAIERKCLELHG